MATKKKPATKKTTPKKNSGKSPRKIVPSKRYCRVGYITEALSKKWNVKEGAIYACIDNLVIHVENNHPEVAAQMPNLRSFVKNTLDNYDEMSKLSSGGVMLIYRGSTHSPVAIAKYGLKFNSKSGFWVVSTMYIKGNSKLPNTTEKVKRKKKNR